MFSTKECSRSKGRSRDGCLRSEHATDQATLPCRDALEQELQSPMALSYDDLSNDLNLYSL